MNNVINDEYELCEAILKMMTQSGVSGTDNVFIGRIPLERKQMNSAWSISSNGGEVSGGNLASPKKTYRIQIARHTGDADAIYGVGRLLDQAIRGLANNYNNVLRAELSPVIDENILENEDRRGAWNATILIIDPNWI